MGKRIGAGAVARLLLGTALAVSACTVHQTSAPALTGPSDFALSMNVTATPDSLALDGGSQSAVVVEARDATGGPRAGVSFRLDILVGQTVQDCGQLSARNVVTGSDGRATSVFTAPSLPLPFPNCANFVPGNVVTIGATPSGANFQTANVRTATIRLVPTGVIVPPADTPTPSFSVSPAAPTANSPVAFNASASCGGAVTAGTGGASVCASTSRIVAYAWSFGDGATASGITSTHTFGLAQTYSVTLTVTNDRGVAASVTLAVAMSAGVLPTAAFSFSPSTPVVGQQVVFNGSASAPGAGHAIAQYTWVFGDGDSETGMVVSHDFLASGIYNVTLTVTDESGQKATVANPVTVGAGTATPKASFTYSPASPVTLNSLLTALVTVDGGASSASNGTTIVTYTWSFGDGSPTAIVTTSSSIASHSYTVAGSWTIALTVTDNLGATNTTTRTITIQ